MALVKTKGIVIREQPFQEQDKIITLFTEEEGKIKAIAKGVRRNRSPLVAASLSIIPAKILPISIRPVLYSLFIRCAMI